MKKMIDLIRASEAPASVVRSAAKGSLSLPAAEMIEILVYLALHNKVFAEQASMTLAGWDETSARAVAADRNAPREVLEYFANVKNLRMPLLPSLLENDTVSEGVLAQLASEASPEVLALIVQSNRAQQSEKIRAALKRNPKLTALSPQKLNLHGPIAALFVKEPTAEVPIAEGEPPFGDLDADPDVATFLAEHRAEIAAEGHKPFQPLGGIHDESLDAIVGKVEAPVGELPAPAAATPRKAAAPEEKGGSTLQKIARLNITGRIQLAMKGTKEERSMLIRDGTKIVALAVLESPKISDGEVEKIASQKNVLEAVLRAIPMKRKFAKNYIITRNLVANPRVPLDVALGLMKNLMANDLKAIAGNKEVSETIRKLAIRQFKQKTEKKKD